MAIMHAGTPAGADRLTRGCTTVCSSSKQHACGLAVRRQAGVCQRRPACGRPVWHVPRRGPRREGVRSWLPPRAATEVFEPHLDPAAATAQLSVLAATVGVGAYWWFVVVPSERQALAKEKRKGDLRGYLEEISVDENKGVERWFYTNWLQAEWFQKAQSAKRRRAAGVAGAAATAEAAAGEAVTAAALGAAAGLPSSSAERAAAATGPATTTVEGETAQAAEAEEEEAEYKDAQPAFFSLDNPIVFTAVMLAGAAAVASVLHGG